MVLQFTTVTLDRRRKSHTSLQREDAPILPRSQVNVTCQSIQRFILSQVEHISQTIAHLHHFSRYERSVPHW